MCADDKRENYYLDKLQNEYIHSHDYLRDDVMKIDFYATDLQAEFIKSPSRKIREFASPSWNNQLNILSIFTHEWAINPRIMKTVEIFCDYARINNYESFTF